MYFSSMKENGTRQTKRQLGSEGFAVGFVNERGCRSMKRTKRRERSNRSVVELNEENEEIITKKKNRSITVSFQNK